MLPAWKLYSCSCVRSDHCRYPQLSTKIGCDHTGTAWGTSCQQRFRQPCVQVRKTAMREVKVLQSIRHDNIICLLDVFHVRRRLYLVFEYVEGTVLQVVVSSQHKIGSHKCVQDQQRLQCEVHNQAQSLEKQASKAGHACSFCVCRNWKSTRMGWVI